MSSNTTTETQTAVTKKVKKLKPARKQVKPGDVEKKEAPQTGKEYSEFTSITLSHAFTHGLFNFTDIWYNKWAGGDREDSYSKYVPAYLVPFTQDTHNPLPAKPNRRPAATSKKMQVSLEPTRPV